MVTGLKQIRHNLNKTRILLESAHRYKENKNHLGI